jgi:hypothetical protein
MRIGNAQCAKTCIALNYPKIVQTPLAVGRRFARPPDEGAATAVKPLHNVKTKLINTNPLQVWCSFAEVLLGEARFERSVKAQPES